MLCADAHCGRDLRELMGVNAAGLDCLKKSRDAQRECLDHVRMGPSAAVPAGAPSVARPKPTSDGWTIGETTSPVDFSPLLVAKLRPVAPASDRATVLMLRCRSPRIELSVRAQGTWRPSRAGDADVAANRWPGYRTLPLVAPRMGGRPSFHRTPPTPSEPCASAGSRSRLPTKAAPAARRTLRCRKGPRKIGRRMPLASVADRATRPFTKKEAIDDTNRDETGFMLRPNVCWRFLRPLTDRRSVRMGLLKTSIKIILL
jgi:hypothetical protein